MKKIININLAGRVIPIEDSAYESLQRYIESLRRYFAGEEGRDEIINDIESRIAELMDDKVRRGASAVTDTDIEEIIHSMGRVEDFEREEKEAASNAEQQQSGSYSQQQQESKRPRGRLFRDNSDKIIGGVASGLANYLDVDPAVIRILLILFGFTGTGILLYIILWIVLPEKNLDNYRGKRLFRNPDDKVIAGVAGGLGTYFNIQAWVIRLILVSPLLLNIIFGTFNGLFFSWHRDIFPNVFIAPFTGTFILAYIILWMVLPEARSPFEKMEMRGEKVDVNRIRQNVQEGMGDFKTRMQAWGEEVKTSAQQFGERAKEFGNTRGKEFVNEVRDTARPAGQGCLHVFGVIIKAFFIFIAGCIALSLFAALIALIFGGVASWPINEFLWTSNLQKLSAWGTLLFFITVPVVAFMTWLIRRVVNARRGAHLGWIFGGLWTLGWICAIFFAASIAKDLRVYDRANPIEVPLNQPVNGRIIVKVNEPEIHYSGTIWWVHDDNNGWDISDNTMRYNNVKIRAEKSEDSFYHVRVYKYSAGSSLADAQRRAERTTFNVSTQDSILNVGSGLMIDKAAKFRGQGVIVEIEIPVGKKIRFDETVMYAYNDWVVRKAGRNYHWHWQSDWNEDYFANDIRPNKDYVMDSDGNLVDTAKPVEEKNNSKSNDKDSLRQILQEQKRVKDSVDREINKTNEELKKNKSSQTNTPDESTTMSTDFGFSPLII
jgi:phage shock protein PspC (stress-responsive transcriptional regulator)